MTESGPKTGGHLNLSGVTALGTAVTLAPLPPARAQDLGRIFSAIEPWAGYGFAAAALATYFAEDEPGAPRLAAFADGQIAGVLGLRLRWLRGMYIQFLGIVPEYQGRGLGGALIAWLEREARAAGKTNLWLCASETNVPALMFYERRGFGRVALLDAVLAEGKAEILMRKRLL